MTQHIVWVSWIEHHRPYDGATRPAEIWQAYPVYVERHHAAHGTAAEINRDPLKWLRDHGKNPELCITPEAHAERARACDQCSDAWSRRLTTGAR